VELIVQLIALGFSIILHEIAHGYVAHRLGDPTAKNAGRLTLNPLAHIDPFGSILLPMMLAITHSPVLLGWAKPVPYNPAYFRDVRKGTMLVGAAGPATNLILAAASAALLRLLTPGGIAALFLLHLCVVNVVLCVFNLLPVPPLDGSRVVVGLLPAELARSYLRLERFGFLIVFGLLWLGALDYVVEPVYVWLLRLLLRG
jgi:Zn-dependent protease